MNLMEYAVKTSSNLCGWDDDGLCIVVRNPDLFMRHVVTKFFFKGDKFQSFQRKLYRWGFRVVIHYGKRGSETIGYQAKNFQRGRMDLVCQMRSVTVAIRKTTIAQTTQEQPQEESSQSSLSTNSKGCDVSPLIVNSLDDTLISFAAVKTALLTNDINLLRMYNLEPNPIHYSKHRPLCGPLSYDNALSGCSD
jgi:hypothetical protein